MQGTPHTFFLKGTKVVLHSLPMGAADGSRMAEVRGLMPRFSKSMHLVYASRVALAQAGDPVWERLDPELVQKGVLEALRRELPANSMILGIDEMGPVATKKLCRPTGDRNQRSSSRTCKT
jgi:hypothetical protein